MSASLVIQQAIYALLRADATLATLLAEDDFEGSPSAPAVYDHAPQASAPEDDSNFPYVVIGDDTAVPFDTDDINGQETTVTLHIWDRSVSRLGRKRVKEIEDALYDVLHEAELSVSGHNAVFCFWDFAESVPDPDPFTKHQVTRFRIVTQAG